MISLQGWLNLSAGSANETVSIGESINSWILTSAQGSPSSSKNEISGKSDTHIVKINSLKKFKLHIDIILQNLEQLLTTTLVGRAILKEYEKTKCLSNASRGSLGNSIVDFWISEETNVHTSTFVQIVDEIKRIFPTEEKVFRLHSIRNKF